MNLSPPSLSFASWADELAFHTERQAEAEELRVWAEEWDREYAHHDFATRGATAPMPPMRGDAHSHPSLAVGNSCRPGARTPCAEASLRTVPTGGDPCAPFRPPAGAQGPAISSEDAS